MKKLLLLSAAFLSLLGVNAESVTPKEAQQAAAQFLSSKGKSLSVRSALAFKGARKSVKGVKLAKNAASYYVFNAENGGYAIVSGDDRTETILGYADSGKFDAAQMPPHVAAWLATYTDEIQLLDAGKIVPARRATRSMTERAVAAIQPLLKTLWNQHSPYNDNCPVLSDGSRAVTGCVATAFAQVMNYHQWPEQTIKEIPAYTTRSNKLSVSAIPTDTKIDWNNMRNTYSASNNDAEKKAVANLMHLCGASVEMDYGPSSGAVMSRAATAAKNYFNYPASTKSVERSSVTASEWFDIIYQELEAGRPVIYGGQSTGGGHAFVCDGYDGEGFFHINWGWGGMSNGYFRLSVMNPENSTGAGASASSDGYAMDQDIVIGMTKPQNDATATAAPLKLTAQNLSISDKTIVAGFFNWSGKVATFETGYQAISQSNGTVTTRATTRYKGNLNLNSGWRQVPINITSFTLEDGKYKVYPVSREVGQGDWQRSSGEYFNVKVEGGQYTITLPNPTLKIVKVEYPGSKIKGMSQEVKITFKNETDDEFNDKVKLLINQGQGLAQVTQTQVVALPQSEETVSFYLPAGITSKDYEYSVAKDANTIYGTFTTAFEQLATLSSVSIESIRLTNAASSLRTDRFTNVFGSTIDATITFKNLSNTDGLANIGQIGLLKEKGNTGSYNGSAIANLSLRIAANGTAEYKFKLEAQEMDKNYMMLVLDQQYLFKLVPGVSITKADGSTTIVSSNNSVTVAEDVVAADFRGLSMTNVTPNANPNTLYVFDESAAVPQSLNGKNVVKGEKAESITLTDEKDFMSPIAFTAKSITYKREVKKGASIGANGWETLVLPFAATSVKIDNQDSEITWLKTKGDDGRFWLKEFVGVDGSTAYYSNVEQMRANHPYIVAFPNATYGEEYNLVGKTIVFSAENAEVLACPKQNKITSTYRFHGNTVAETMDRAYILNEDGNKFELTAQGKIAPFRACFQPMDGSRQITTQRLSIGNADVTAIEPLKIDTAPAAIVNIYSLSGQVVRRVSRTSLQQTLTALPSGIYVVDGKKIIR